MNNKITNTKYYGDIADAIRSKNGEETKYKPAEMAKAIKGIKTSGGGNSAIKPGYITFIDTDGSVIAEYAPDELPLAELPPIPDHSTDEVSLIDGQWNWTLDEINGEHGKNGATVGPTYETYDGHTHFIIELNEQKKYFQLRIGIISGSADIAWGDGSTTHITTTGVYGHDYTDAGRYDVVLAVSGDINIPTGAGSIIGPYPSSVKRLYTVLSTVKKIYGGHDGIGLLDKNSFANDFINLEYASFSAKDTNGVYAVGMHILDGCKKLRVLIIPRKNTQLYLKPYSCCSAESMKCISLPQSVTSIGNDAFKSCSSLQSVTIPQGVTSIGNSAFQYSLECIHLESTEPPTLTGTSAFTAPITIYVPAASVDAYKAATNWAYWTDSIVGE